MTTPSSSPIESLGRLRARLRERAMSSNLNPRDADLLLCHILGRSLPYLISHSDDPVDSRTADEASHLIDRRLAEEPLQYIRGYTEFYGRRFAVDPRALIPRPETEILVEAAIGRVTAGSRVLDVGTGTGCIAISIEREVPGVRVTGSDSSLGALALARHNAKELASRATFLAADFLAPLCGPFDLIVSNPPYIPEEVVEGLAPEVQHHEPRGALTPGPRGTEAFEVLLHEGARLLKPAGILILEIGFDQSHAVRRLALEAGWAVVEVIPDLAGIPRVVVLSPPSAAVRVHRTAP
jgi:release factor glutamine methyltransferase